MVTIDWKLVRLDEGEAEQEPEECLLEVNGSVQVEGERAGWVRGFYLHAEDLSSDVSFWELWDVDSRSCALFERIFDRKWHRLREPLPRLLLMRPGILCVDELVLFPEFRGRGMGLQVMGQVVGSCADIRVGAVLLESDPWQYEAEQEESRDSQKALAKLPTDDRDGEREKLQHHFRTWRMQLLPRTTYMVAAPEILHPEPAARWPPCTIQDLSNSCVLCDGLIDYEHDEWTRTSEGPAHTRCVVV